MGAREQRIWLRAFGCVPAAGGIAAIVAAVHMGQVGLGLFGLVFVALTVFVWRSV